MEKSRGKNPIGLVPELGLGHRSPRKRPITVTDLSLEAARLHEFQSELNNSDCHLWGHLVFVNKAIIRLYNIFGEETKKYLHGAVRTPLQKKGAGGPSRGHCVGSCLA
ncbi:hypothetical protein CDAR_293121 [Caerostris darwini]|uniref:Uncharacterized protein n=1 Tax=Caerostris darwini TaxID=1538125 RepID=A0AAV4TJ17_9ARAC|nr:hypothetical protein CDAR_293121 [Caerostris darwini]